jgi:hypothetical protein
MSIQLSKETTRKFAGRTLKQGEHVLARMLLSFTDLDGNQLPDETRECEAYVSRIENDIPLFIAINPYKDKVIAIRQMRMLFVESKNMLVTWTWTWPEAEQVTAS